MADQRLSTDDRQMKRTVSAYETENTVNERVAAQVIQLSKSNTTAQVISAVHIATRAVQRTLPRDFDGQQRTVTAEHPPPRGKHAPGIHGIAALSGDWIERVRLVTGCCHGLSGANGEPRANDSLAIQSRTTDSRLEGSAL